MMRRFTLALLLSCVASPAWAQDQSAPRANNAGDALTYLLLSQAGGGGNPSGAIDSGGVVDAIREFINTQTSTFPVATSSAGFSYEYDPTLRRSVLTSRSFGPLFAQRPLTSGRGQLGVTFNVQSMNWSRIDGISLDSPGLQFIANYQLTAAPSADGVIERTWTSAIRIRTTTAVVGATYGVRDRVDVGVTMPFTWVRVDGESFETSRNYYGASLPPDSAPSPHVTGDSRGVGDITGRVKWNFYKDETTQWSIDGEVRAPTGDATALLGTGHTSLRAILIGGREFGNLSLHVNAGYAANGSGVRMREPAPDPLKGAPRLGPVPGSWLAPSHFQQLYADIHVEPSNEFNYTLGGDYVVTDRVTLAADAIGRTLVNGAKLVNVLFTSPLLPVSLGLGSGGVATQQPFLQSGTATILLGVAGAKIRLGGKWLVTANALLPMSRTGLTPSISGVIGLERAFSR